MLLLKIIQAVLLAYLGWAAVYQFFFSAAGKFRRKNRRPQTDLKRRIAVFIPGYKEDSVIVHSATEALKQNYPSELYDVIVVADSFQDTTLARLTALPIKVVVVKFEQSTKSRALNKALDAVGNDYQIAVILDADNIMAPDFLDRINHGFNQGHVAIQGHRAAKNLDQPMAALDGASEEINTHILCKGHRVVGLSSRLAGSGMAFDYRLFRRTMRSVDAIGGFDKELELRLTKKGIFLAYDEAAYVYDEKVSRADHFSKQRSRWIAAQFHYFKNYFPGGLKALLRDGNFDHFNKVMQMALPPRLMLPGVLFAATVVSWIVATPVAWLWTAALVFNVLSFEFGIPSYFYKKEYLKMWLHLPSAFFSMIKAVGGIGQANKKFIHTPHQMVELKQKRA